MCDQGLSQIFSDEFLYNNDSKRVLEKVFHHEPKASGKLPSLGTLVFYGLWIGYVHISSDNALMLSFHIVKKCHLMRHSFVWRWRQNLPIVID